MCTCILHFHHQRPIEFRFRLRGNLPRASVENYLCRCRQTTCTYVHMQYRTFCQSVWPTVINNNRWVNGMKIVDVDQNLHTTFITEFTPCKWKTEIKFTRENKAAPESIVVIHMKTQMTQIRATRPPNRVFIYLLAARVTCLRRLAIVQFVVVLQSVKDFGLWVNCSSTGEVHKQGRRDGAFTSRSLFPTALLFTTNNATLNADDFRHCCFVFINQSFWGVFCTAFQNKRRTNW